MSENKPPVKSYCGGKPNYCTEPEDWVTRVVATHEDGTYTTERVPLPKREWVGLTEQDVHDAFQFTELIKQLSWGHERAEWCENFAAYIEAKLKERNT